MSKSYRRKQFEGQIWVHESLQADYEAQMKADEVEIAALKATLKCRDEEIQRLLSLFPKSLPDAR